MTKLKLLTFIILILLSSCTLNQNLVYENAQLKQRISELELEVQSCRDTVLDFQTTSKIKSTEKAKKRKGTKSGQKLYSTDENQTYKVSKNYSYSSQCQAMTKKRRQCSRSARSGGYCWQHGG